MLRLGLGRICHIKEKEKKLEKVTTAGCAKKPGVYSAQVCRMSPIIKKGKML